MTNLTIEFKDLHKEQKEVSNRVNGKFLLSTIGDKKTLTKILVVAHIQSGKFGSKTGIIDKLFNSLATAYLNGQNNKRLPPTGNTDFYFWLPSDNALEGQTKERLSKYIVDINMHEYQCDKLCSDYLTYSRSATIKKTQEALISSAERGRNIIIIEDEAHIGKGDESKSADFLKFFNELEMSSGATKTYISVTATPTHLSGQTINKFLNDGWEIEFLDYNENYYGLYHLVNDPRRRFKEMTWDFKYEDDVIDFTEKELITHWENTDEGFFVVRLPKSSYEMFNSTVTNTFVSQNLNPPIIKCFGSTTKNIKDFVSYFEGKNKNKIKGNKAIFCIIESIKQGVTLDLSKCAMWVDRLNKSKTKIKYDNIAMHAQSIGRCVGYQAGQYSFPVYGNSAALLDHWNDLEIVRDYVINNKESDHVFGHTGSNVKPMNNSNQNILTMSEDLIIENILIHDNVSDLNESIFRLQGKSRGISTCSNNIKDFSKSILTGNLNQHGTSVRGQPTLTDNTIDVTPVYLDSPSKSDKNGQNFNCLKNTKWGDLRHKYVVILSKSKQKKSSTYNNQLINNTTCFEKSLS